MEKIKQKQNGHYHNYLIYFVLYYKILVTWGEDGRKTEVWLFLYKQCIEEQTIMRFLKELETPTGFKKLDFEKATRNNALLKVKKPKNLNWNDI